ncbi:ribosomal protein L10 family protein [Actinidia rufa]|uniref:Ribosomal protein L10 family protein n=1 Tax=Actinidia rufa TaxID=165716 RepID=A0A7J0GVF5_9ERIC|nr:ribosomal protein L10 family protein [Actinidia rufa]
MEATLFPSSLSLKSSTTTHFRPIHRRPPPIVPAISRTKKEQTVETVKDHLQDCHLLAGIKYQGLTVKQFQDLRNSLPGTTTLLGMNAWMFVHSEEIPAALKPYRSFQKEKKLEEHDFSGAVFEGRFYPPEEFQALETMPTRAEIYARLLGAVQGPATAVVATLQAPARDLVLVLKAYVKKLEESSGAQ